MHRYARQMLGRTAASVVLDTQTVTVAESGTTPNRLRGFYSGVLGSISDGTSNVYGGDAILRMVFDESGGNAFILLISNSHPNSGWNAINNVTDGLTLSRASASYADLGTETEWRWNSQAIGGFFASTGAKTVTFTS